MLGLHVEAAGHFKVGDDADNGARGFGKGADQPRDVVLEKRFLVRLEKRNDFNIVEAVRAGKPHVDWIRRRAQLHALQAELRRAVLVLGKRQRIDDAQVDVTAGDVIHLLEQFAHAVRITAQ